MRKFIYWFCFILILIWSAICSFFSFSLLPFLMKFFELAFQAKDGAQIAASGIANLTFLSVLIGMWFFPTVGLGMIALVAKPDTHKGHHHHSVTACEKAASPAVAES